MTEDEKETPTLVLNRALRRKLARARRKPGHELKDKSIEPWALRIIWRDAERSRAYEASLKSEEGE